MLATSKNVLFPGHNNLLTTSTLRVNATAVIRSYLLTILQPVAIASRQNITALLSAALYMYIATSSIFASDVSTNHVQLLS